jgi:hypothetical protein
LAAGLIERSPTPHPHQPLARFLTKSALGISGRLNRNGNDGTITRFGWKAQNKSLLLFSGEAYNVEMGITNELFQQRARRDAHLPVRDGSQRHAELRRPRRRARRAPPRSRTSPTSSASSRRPAVATPPGGSDSIGRGRRF